MEKGIPGEDHVCVLGTYYQNTTAFPFILIFFFCTATSQLLPLLLLLFIYSII